MPYSFSILHSIRIKSINHLGRNHGILRQYYLSQFSRNLEFSTDTSTRTNYSPENWNLDNFLSHYNSFKPLMERSSLGILIDFEDYKEKKKLLKESIRSLEYDLDSYDDKTLFGILLYCLEMSDKCLNDTFNLRLVELLISRFQSVKSGNDMYNRSKDSNNTTNNTINNTDITATDPSTITIGLNSSLSDNKDVLSLDYSFISKIFDDEVHLVYLLSAFHKLKLHLNLENHFEYFYLSLNRNVGNYSSENLVELCKNLGDLYYLTNLGGIKILVQKCVYSLLEQIDKYSVNVSVYDWIQLIKSINKCNENHLFKKLVPYLTATIQSSPFTTRTSNCYYFDPKTNTYKISKEESKKYYKFVKLNVQLLDTVLTTGMIENQNLFESIFQLISNYLLFYTSKTSKFKSLSNNTTSNSTSNNNTGGRINISGTLNTNSTLNMFTNTKTINEYNQPNELVNELLYKKYSNKLFKSPSYTPTTNSSSVLSGSEKTEKNLLEYGLLNMLHNGNVVFVRGLKMCEMYMRTLYPSLYSKLSKNTLLQVLRQLPFESEKDYSYVTNIMNENKDIIHKYVSEQDSPMIVLVDIYYLICTNYNKKLYVEIIDGNNRRNRNKDNIDNRNGDNSNNKNNSRSNETNNNNRNNIDSYDDNYYTSNKPNKLSSQVEFKLQYLKSLGWTCIQIHK